MVTNYICVSNYVYSGHLLSLFQVTLYRKMPLKAMSRLWGKMTCWHLPITLREPLLGLYVRMFNVNLEEALNCDLKHYTNLSEFFRRELKPDARVVDPQSPVVSRLKSFYYTFVDLL